MLKERLTELYNDGSKHSRYQNIPDFVKKELEYTETIDENWRGDTARFNYLKAHTLFGQGKSIGEIGANTGFFILSLAHENPDSAFYAYEINPTHAGFIAEIADSFQMKNVTVNPLGIDMDGIQKMAVHDILLNYNVLHHAGVDFDTNRIESVEKYETYAVEYLTKLRAKTHQMIFQMGYNWGGNKLKPIVPLQDDAEKMAFTLRIFKKAGWKVQDIALHTRVNKVLKYQALSQEVLQQLSQAPAGTEKEKIEKLVDFKEMPEFSEFYRRPIFTFCSNCE
ncbi:MAG TPA: hypothetical protein VFP20_03845 [Bacteroidales bacterium]|nr:hypothetical protein [Bacteroidales bacterium]